MFNRTRKGPATPDASLIKVETYSKLQHPFRLNFYDLPPIHNITLEEFETWAIDRLRVLAEIEASFIRNHSFEQLQNVITTQCEKYLPLEANKSLDTKISTAEQLEAERKKDHVSHFVLRLAFCRSEDLRYRFVKAETALFRVRFLDDLKKEREEFLRARKFGGEPVSLEEKAQYKNELMATTNSIKTEEDFNAETFYKVHWTKVTDLVSTRRVFLKAGYAYVPSSAQSSIIIQEFQSRLENALAETAKALPRLDEDDRLLPIISHLSQGFLAGVANEYAGGEDGLGSEVELKAEMIDELAQKHFPMCMRYVHDVLRRDNHLKHQGRLQYTLFLKVLGLPIEEAISFWRQAYGQTMSDDKFNKEYRYNIRHSYGLEGKRANYPARSCQAIITSNHPGPKEHHGCPFRHFPAENLRSALSSQYNISNPSDVSQILAAVDAKHYHVACTKVFELGRVGRGVQEGDGVGDGESVSHPNRYAARSWELEKEERERARAKVIPLVPVEGHEIETGEDQHRW